MATFTKSDLFKRAHKLCRLNKNNVRRDGYRAVFAWALRFAWNELNTGKTRFWTPAPRIDVLRAQLIDLEGRPLAQRVSDQIAAVRSEISQLEMAA